MSSSGCLNTADNHQLNSILIKRLMTAIMKSFNDFYSSLNRRRLQHAKLPKSCHQQCIRGILEDAVGTDNRPA